MITQYARQAEAILKAAQHGQLPEHVQAAAHDGLAKTRAATLKSIALLKDSVDAVERLVNTVQQDAKTLAAKALDNVVANTEAVFNAAQAIARAKDINEAAHLQAKFLQTQFAKAGEQGKEFYELAAELTQQRFATVNTIATKSLTQFAA